MFHRLLASAEDLVTFATLSLVFAFIKCLISPEPRSLRAKAVQVVIAVLVGTMSGGLALEMGAGDFAALAICSGFSLISDALIKSAIENRGWVADLFKQALGNIVNKTTK